MLEQNLRALLSQTDITVSDLQIVQLIDYVQLLDKWNKTYNLTSVRDPNEMLVKHIMDSLSVGKHLKGNHFIDVGTGPGLPGIPLSILYPERNFVLLDSLGKRITFLRQVILQLKLTNVTPVQSRVEAYQPDVPFDGVLSRAFSSLQDMVSWCHHLIDIESGRFFALKGVYPTDELAQLPEHIELVESFPLVVPSLEGERHLIELKKHSKKFEGAVGRIIAVANQKGGVGKTTTSVNLAASLAATKRKVLLIDLDPQGNATMGSGVDKYDSLKTSYELLIEQQPFDQVVCKDTSGVYDLIAANADVTAAEIKLMEVYARELRLRNALAPVKDDYDFIIVDCPPSLNMLTVNAMAAADSVLVPMQCEYYALEGLTALMETISQLTSVVNADLKIEGILRTMYDPRNRLANDVSEQLKRHFGDKVYRTVIPRNVRLAEAPSFGAPAMYYDKSSTGAKAYLALAGEILRRDEVAKKTNNKEPVTE